MLGQHNILDPDFSTYKKGHNLHRSDIRGFGIHGGRKYYRSKEDVIHIDPVIVDHVFEIHKNALSHPDFDPMRCRNHLLLKTPITSTVDHLFEVDNQVLRILAGSRLEVIGKDSSYGNVVLSVGMD